MRASQVRRSLVVVLGLCAVLGSCAPSVVGRGSDTSSRAAYLTFLSDPPGARVLLNGVELPGVTPILHTPIAPGFVQIEIVNDGYRSAIRQATFEPGSAQRIDVRLELLPEPTRTATASPSAPPAATATPGRPVVSITSDPPGARVRVDGVALRRTTPIEHLDLSPGPHRFEFHLDGHAPVVLEREWPQGGPQSLDVALLVAPATVAFTSSPGGATVRVNGVTLEGSTPLQGVLLPGEASDIIIALEGYSEQKLERNWRPLMVDSVHVDMEPALATVSFSSEPPGALVTIDGRDLGRTAIEAARLPTGAARITFALHGHESVTLERAWQAGEVDRVAVVLFPTNGTVRIDSAAPWIVLEIDGKPVDATPGEPIELAQGTHVARSFRGDDVGEAQFEIVAGKEIGVELVWRRLLPHLEDYSQVPAGTATLGDVKFGEDNPPRETALGDFWIGRMEVTVAQYGACVVAGKCAVPGTASDCNWNVAGRENHPVNCVRASDARAYAVWLGEQSEIAHELPTCDQWERAARLAGRYPWGDEEPGARCNSCDVQCPFANFRNDAIDDGAQATAPVASLPGCRSPHGVFDMTGNVAEWCRSGTDGHQVRGGSWGQVGVFLDPAFAVRRDGNDRDPTVGFRLIVPRPE